MNNEPTKDNIVTQKKYIDNTIDNYINTVNEKIIYGESNKNYFYNISFRHTRINDINFLSWNTFKGNITCHKEKTIVIILNSKIFRDDRSTLYKSVFIEDNYIIREVTMAISNANTLTIHYMSDDDDCSDRFILFSNTIIY
ncbi:MAG: hypothetical protein EOP34_02715 [Rickettsiales bacterium]|nr:MAG: hypothetical protein EOP34_02715 [Rickettsiales bacterium]